MHLCLFLLPRAECRSHQVSTFDTVKTVLFSIGHQKDACGLRIWISSRRVKALLHELCPILYGTPARC